jgi:single-stranded-DNA-specific exonuclease
MATTATPTTPWQAPLRDLPAESVLQSELGVPSLLAAVLVQRGLSDPEEADRFLRPSLDRLHSPSLLPDYEAARDAILGARERKELVFIHGDYDVDGVTSAALFSRFLRSIGCEVHTHVPHRMREGYGIHLDAVAAAKELGAKLFLTCDCGVSAHEQVRAAREAGMAVVVTDHHSVGETLPEAQAVVNPHRSDSRYPFPELSGVGVAFKLCEGLTRELGHEPRHFHRAFLDLAALGTIADVMPLRDENRIIAHFGLGRLAETRKIGLQALMRAANVAGPLRSYHVGFVLGPRLNAAGRIDDAALALELLIEQDESRADDLAKRIEAINLQRRTEQQKMIEQAEEIVLSSGHHERNVIVVANEGWHTGIVGIVAGRLVERFRRPTFVLSIDPADGVCKGSARTIPNFHLADAIRVHRDLFLSGGGHAMAAGCSFRHEDLSKISDALHVYAGELLTEEDFLPRIEADAEVAPSEVTYQAVEALSAMEPFGCENPEPSFIARDVRIAALMPTKNPDHMRLTLSAPEAPSIAAIAFGIGRDLAAQPAGGTADFFFQPVIEEWNGRRTLKWQIRAFDRRLL